MTDRKHITKIGDKEFILFPGLLEAAHADGLSSVKTELVQRPINETDPVAIVYAEVTTKRGTFQGIGDASPSNVGPMVKGAIIRMAETRAIARALRFATNIGMTAYEELGGDAPPVERTRLGPAKDPNVPGPGYQDGHPDNDLPFDEPNPFDGNGSDARGGEQPQFERTMKSKFAEGRCGFCGKNHIPLGSEIGVINNKWGAPECAHLA